LEFPSFFAMAQWCNTMVMAPVIWQMPTVIVVQTVQKSKAAHELSLADAIPVPPTQPDAEDNTDAVGLDDCRRRPRTKCRAEARRRRDTHPRRRESQHCLSQDSDTASPVLSSPCEKLTVDTVGVSSLRSHFSELDQVPCERIFLVRKIQRLGLNSADAVRAHFSTYGDVEDVLVAHSPVLSGCKTYVRRFRPSNLAIVTMRTAEMATRVHAQGKDHVIQGSFVLVEPYERRGQAQGRSNELDSDTCDSTSCGDASFDLESRCDGSSSYDNDVSSDEDVACISGHFEYWATDDEGEW